MEMGEKIGFGQAEGARDPGKFGKAFGIVRVVKGALRGKVGLRVGVDQPFGAGRFDPRDGGRAQRRAPR